MRLPPTTGISRSFTRPAGKPDGAHTDNQVAFVLMDPRTGGPIGLRDGALSDVAPTVLDVMGIKKPREMTGESLVSGHEFGQNRPDAAHHSGRLGAGGPDGKRRHFCRGHPFLGTRLSQEVLVQAKRLRPIRGAGSGQAGQLGGRAHQPGSGPSGCSRTTSAWTRR